MDKCEVTVVTNPHSQTTTYKVNEILYSEKPRATNNIYANNQVRKLIWLCSERQNGITRTQFVWTRYHRNLVIQGYQLRHFSFP